MAEAAILGRDVLDMNPHYHNKNVMVEDLYDYSGALWNKPIACDSGHA